MVLPWPTPQHSKHILHVLAHRLPATSSSAYIVRVACAHLGALGMIAPATRIYVLMWLQECKHTRRNFPYPGSKVHCLVRWLNVSGTYGDPCDSILIVVVVPLFEAPLSVNNNRKVAAANIRKESIQRHPSKIWITVNTNIHTQINHRSQLQYNQFQEFL